MKKATYLTLVLGLISYSLIAQNSTNDFDLDGDLAKWNDEIIGKEYLAIYEGEYYIPEFAPRVGGTHLYYKDSQWLRGAIMFRGQEYQDIDFQYDLYSDVLVVLNRAAFPTQPLRLPQAQIQYFEIDKSLFRYFNEAEAPSFGKGFYEVLYEGKLSVIAKRKKLRDSKGTAVEFMRYAIYYKESDRYFLQMDGEYYPFKSKKNFYALFKPQKSEIKKFIKSNRLKIKPGNDVDIRRLAQFCNELK